MPAPDAPTQFDPTTADPARLYLLRLLGEEEITVAPGIPLTAVTRGSETNIVGATVIDGTLAVGEEAAIVDGSGSVSGLLTQITSEPLSSPASTGPSRGSRRATPCSSPAAGPSRPPPGRASRPRRTAPDSSS